MSGGKHTAEPWAIEPCTHLVWGPAPDIADTRTWGNSICETKSSPREFGNRITVEEAGYNATRIVDCVNALQGIENPAAFREVFDELVGALGAVSPLLSVGSKVPNTPKSKDIIRARKALAKAKELQS